FHRGFTFRDATALVPYLADLGVSDVYASPLFAARAGSTHGYDVCDHRRLNPELGSEGDFRTFPAPLREHALGRILYAVPHHMGVNDQANAWWTDVLENGRASEFASHFDIDWKPVTQELANRVLLPVLDDQYGRVLEAGRFKLEYEGGAFAFGFGPLRLPLA